MTASLVSELRGQFGMPVGALGHLAGWIMAWRPSNRDRNRWTVALLRLQPGDRALEIGSGPGFALSLAAHHLAHGGIVGLDHSAVMNAQARARNRAAVDAGRVRLELGSFERLPELGGRFDKVFAVNVFQFLPDRSRNPQIHCECGDFPSRDAMPDRFEALRMIKQVLKPGGLLALTYMPRHANAVAADADRFATVLSREMVEAGYRNVRIERLELKPLPAVCVLGAC